MAMIQKLPYPGQFIIGLVLCLYFGLKNPEVQAQIQAQVGLSAQQLHERGMHHFQAGRYDQAIAYLRRYLISSPKDDTTWNILAAASYHAGLPKRALRYLKSVESKTSQKSYNYYYQGLAYGALNSRKKAEQYFTKVLPFNDLYTSYSVFELGILNYNQKNMQTASYWFSTYLQRYPQGPFAMRAYVTLESVQRGEYLENLEGTANPDMEGALYRYNSLSLINFPHFWLFQIGSTYAELAGKEPKIDPNSGGTSLNNTLTVDQSIQATYGAGIGTYNWQGNLLTAGYFYKQIWHTNAERMEIYMDDPLDFEYFAFRPDLMERRHQFFVDFRRNITDAFYLGVYGRLEYARIGSSLFKTAEDSQVQKTLKLYDMSLLIPWVGLLVTKDLRLSAYYYLRKELNDDEPAFSNKTYDFVNGEPLFSLGFTASFDVPHYQLHFTGEYFHYEFIYNDIFLDYTRDGFLFGAQYDLWNRIFFQLRYGMYNDVYFAENLRQTSCNATIQEFDNAEDPKRCRREDTGYLIEAEAFWNYTQFHRFGFKYVRTQNDSKTLQQHDSSRNSYLLTLTIAFPSVTRALRFTERFADAAFTKENY